MQLVLITALGVGGATIFGSIIGFGNKAKILYPPSVVEQCKALCNEALNQY